MVKTITRNEMLKEVMLTAHKNFSSKFNTRSWAECLKNAWYAIKTKIRYGHLKIQKKVKTMVFAKLEKRVIRCTEADYYAMGYGRGPGFYCGD